MSMRRDSGMFSRRREDDLDWHENAQRTVEDVRRTDALLVSVSSAISLALVILLLGSTATGVLAIVAVASWLGG